MKKLLLVLTLSSTIFATAQDEGGETPQVISTADTETVQGMDKWSIGYQFGFNIGTTAPLYPHLDVKKLNFTHHAVNGRYMINNRMGIMLDASYDKFIFRHLDNLQTHYVRASVQTVINLTDILRVYELHPRFGLLFHGGFGYSVMFQTKPEKTPKDNMANGMVGITPQLRIAKSWSIQADASFIFNYSQHYTFNWQHLLRNVNPYKSSIAGFADLSIGITYHIGKHKNHADWVPTDPAFYPIKDRGPQEVQEIQEPVDLTELEDKIKENEDKIKELEDLINSLKDKDPGLFEFDEDGNRKLTPKGKEYIAGIARQVYFNTDKSTLKTESFEPLNRLITLLEENDDIDVKIDGHADSTGNPAYNLRLSKARANSVKEYLVNNGISSSRITTEGFGDTKPVADNKTAEGRAKNRRVEITLKL